MTITLDHPFVPVKSESKVFVHLNFKCLLKCFMASKVQVLEVLKAKGAVSVTVEASNLARKLITTMSRDVETQQRCTQLNLMDQKFVVVYANRQ